MTTSQHSAEERSNCEVITREIATDWTDAYRFVMRGLLETNE